MLISYATKKNKYGVRKVLIIDYDKKIFSVSASRWYSPDDYIEIGATDRKFLIDKLLNSGFKAVDVLTAGIEF